MVLFAQRLKEIRVSQKITQKAVAEFLNIKETSYQHYEYGKREPNYETLFKLCHYFNVSADYLLGLSDDPIIHRKEDTHEQ
ncbi:Helix-turn-helix [Anaerovirgula multivorans]|uniref:Helix-turn-helix n=1 Tax=Anaerovirgula multivorans TaxID=312168 RepID=A0A239B631_9FIRM|nr:helix-turn-helix transcriptional regulator [Anaerovirgula multivorans]SNS03229.1 Helix-turn-helix [Anaerovirgula multivorans]